MVIGQSMSDEWRTMRFPRGLAQSGVVLLIPENQPTWIVFHKEIVIFTLTFDLQWRDSVNSSDIGVVSVLDIEVSSRSWVSFPASHSTKVARVFVLDIHEPVWPFLGRVSSVASGV